MGTCGSREKELRDKVSFNQMEFDRCIKKFEKLSKIPPGLEGFKRKFRDNVELAEKLFQWIRSQSEESKVDMVTFVYSIEMLAKTSTKMFSNAYQMKQLEQSQLWLLISIQNPYIFKKDQFRLTAIQNEKITYLMAGKFFKEVINMMSNKHIILSRIDESVALLLDLIFQSNTSALNIQSFFDQIKIEAPYITKIIKKYFEAKFLDKKQAIKLTILKQPSLILTNCHIALFNLCTPWFYNSPNIQLLFRYQLTDGKFNFNKLANSLLQANCPTFLLFRHDEQGQKEQKQQYVFGYFCASYWRMAPDLTGDYQSCIFSLFPKFQKFTTQRGEGQSKFALIKPIITKRTSQSLHSNHRYSKVPGLGIGGSGYDTHRIWIDGKDLASSYISDQDKTYMKGYILDQSITKLNLDLIEIWGLEQTQISQSMAYFRQTQNIRLDKNEIINYRTQQALSESNSSAQVVLNDLTNVLTSLNQGQVKEKPKINIKSNLMIEEVFEDDESVNKTDRKNKIHK